MSVLSEGSRGSVRGATGVEGYGKVASERLGRRRLGELVNGMGRRGEEWIGELVRWGEVIGRGRGGMGGNRGIFLCEVGGT
jgi:hypothetical protein